MPARRRRTRGTWFPTLGTAGEDANWSGRTFSLVLAAGADMATLIAPITLDRPRDADDPADAGSSLSDIIGSEYILQRIVGKLHAHRLPPAFPNEDPGFPCLFGAGFFVARANDDASGGGPDTPIGSASLAEVTSNYSPLETDTMREPWIWRRTWILGNQGPFFTTGVARAETSAYPTTTAGYGSVMDGPHIDSKVKRRIRQDDRLWFAVAMSLFPPNSTDVVNQNIVGYLDYRLFGSLRKARNTSAF